MREVSTDENLERPLIQSARVKKQILAKFPYAKSAEYFTCVLVALPTAALNAIAALSGDASRLGALRSPSDLQYLLKEANASRIVYGIIALGSSETVLFFLNKRYLLASGKASVDLIRRTALTLRSACSRYELGEKDRAGVFENVLFVWSVATSLIFAEIGGKALSFLELPGEAVGFSLNLAVYFATRFASAKMFFVNPSDKNRRLIQLYFGKLEMLQIDKVDSEISIPTEQRDINHSLMLFLNNIDERWESLPKDYKRVVCLCYIAPIMGYMLAAVTTLPIISGFMPESIQGAEMLTNTDIGKSANYQNIASFTFGTFATALTLFFYELNIKDLPKHFLRTTLSIYEKIKEGNVSDAIKLFGLTLLAFGASYFSGIGFRFVAESAVSDGSLSYLGNWVSGLIPDGLFTAVIAMLWSHLQDLINQSNQELPIIDVERLEQINARNACMLLSQPNTDISPLNGNRYTLFYFDKDYEVQIGNQQKKQSNAQEKNYV